MISPLLNTFYNFKIGIQFNNFYNNKKNTKFHEDPPVAAVALTRANERAC